MSQCPLPVRGQDCAPTFNGKPAQLTRFLRDLEIVFQAHGIHGAADRIRLAKHYAEVPDAETFGSIAPAHQTDWNAFKTALLAEYPGADHDRRYALSDLESVVAKWGAKYFEDRDQVGKYYREFNRIAHFLIDKGRLSSQQRDKMFPNAFTGDLRQRLDTRLQILHPNVHPDDGYAIAQTRDAAVFLVGGGGAQPGSVPGSKTSRVKQESLSIDSVRGLIRNELGSTIQHELAATLATLGVGNTSGGGATAPSGYSGGYGGAPGFRRQSCHFCSDILHMIRDCPVAADYIQYRWISRNPAGRLTLPSGAPLPVSFPGRNLREKIDSYRGKAAGSLLETPASPPHHHLYYPGAIADSDEQSAERLLEQAIRAGLRKLPTTSATLKECFPEDVPVDVTHLADGLLEYIQAAEMPVSLGKLLERMTGDRPTITDSITLHVPQPAEYIANTISTLREGSERHLQQQDKVETAKASVPLRCVYPVIDGKMSPECVLDPGSMTVTMRRDVWERLGRPMSPIGRRSLQSANGQVTTTLGVGYDLPFCFGPVTLRLHVQVVNDAPFEVLLGRPFFQLGRAMLDDQDGGCTYLTIRDPETRKKVIVPTQERLEISAASPRPLCIESNCVSREATQPGSDRERSSSIWCKLNMAPDIECLVLAISPPILPGAAECMPDELGSDLALREVRRDEDEDPMLTQKRVGASSFDVGKVAESCYKEQWTVQVPGSAPSGFSMSQQVLASIWLRSIHSGTPGHVDSHSYVPHLLPEPPPQYVGRMQDILERQEQAAQYSRRIIRFNADRFPKQRTYVLQADRPFREQYLIVRHPGSRSGCHSRNPDKLC